MGQNRVSLTVLTVGTARYTTFLVECFVQVWNDSFPPESYIYIYSERRAGSFRRRSIRIRVFLFPVHAAALVARVLRVVV